MWVADEHSSVFQCDFQHPQGGPEQLEPAPFNLVQSSQIVSVHADPLKAHADFEGGLQNLASSAHSDSPDGDHRDMEPAPFSLVQATARGDLRTSGYSMSTLDDDDLATFAVDWGVSFGDVKGQGWPYDLQAIRALDHHKGGFGSTAPPAKPHQLSECLEVPFSSTHKLSIFA